MKGSRNRDQMPECVFAPLQIDRAAIADRVWPEADHLLAAVEECHSEGVLLMNRRRDCAHFGVASEQADQMRVVPLANVAIHVYGDLGDVFPEFRRYSSRPSRKCAFCILVLSLLVSKYKRSPILVDQSKFIGELFALMDFRVTLLLYFEDRHRFH